MEITDLIRGKTGKVQFISGYQHNNTSSNLTITAPTGQKVILLSLSNIENSASYYTIVSDDITVINNKRLQSFNFMTVETGSFLIGSSGADRYVPLSTVVTPIWGSSISIQNMSGTVNFSYSYLFVSA